ncbi:RNA polymerase sigma factor [Algirhabdus cladophorae]|uniref:RNA polymerase sigma factor n=1 Tax=Algirhabdus cladophorae TaxID=3377108 RepID=UPI003B84A483
MHSDTDLIEQIAKGDTTAMKVFFERHQPALFAFLRGRGADAQMADDAVQDAMLDVWRTASTFQGRANAKTWLFTIGRNKMIDRQRKSARLSIVDDIPETVDDSPSAEAVLMASEDANRVKNCLSKLKPHHLNVIRLAFYEDMTYAQIGTLEDVPEGTIKARIFYAKKLLLRCLGRRSA